MTDLSRRKLIIGGLAATAGVSGLGLAARIARRYGLIPPDHGGIYGLGETLTYASQRLLTRHSLAREFHPSQISKRPLANEIPPLNEAFKRLQAGGFADWRLSVNGMVDRPASFSLAQLRSYPSRSLADALHPQTFLTYGMNGNELPVGNGGPLRMRLPRQLGYKSVKFITNLTVTDSLKSFGKGLGSASPETGYAWYAGI